MPQTAELSPNAWGCRRDGMYSVKITGGTDSSKPPPKPCTSRAIAIMVSDVAEPPIAVPTANDAEPTSSVRHGTGAVGERSADRLSRHLGHGVRRRQRTRTRRCRRGPGAALGSAVTTIRRSNDARKLAPSPPSTSARRSGCQQRSVGRAEGRLARHYSSSSAASSSDTTTPVCGRTTSQEASWSPGTS